jgi:hypothetical protein
MNELTRAVSANKLFISFLGCYEKISDHLLKALINQ